MTRLLLALLSLLLLACAPASAQQVRVEGDVDDPAAEALRAVLARGSFLLLDRDTVLPATTRIPGDLVVVGAIVRLEGSVAGSAVVLPGGELFLRPGASVAGTIATLGGGAYISANATSGQRYELPATVGSRVERLADAYTVVLTPPARPPLVQPGGIMGVGFPTYDRVNGVTLRGVVRARLYRDTTAPVLGATALYHTARTSFGGELSLSFRLGSRYRAGLEAARHSATNEGWIRGALENSLSSLLGASDVRNYYEEDVLALEVGRRPPGEQQPGEGYIAPRLRFEASTSRSLPAREVWSLFGDDDWRPNPAIDDGWIASGTVGAEAGWTGATTTFAGDLAVEWAPGGIGDFDFALLTADAAWDMISLWQHTVSVRGHLLHPLGTSAPAQRWSMVGGPGTLPTLETGQLRGDRLLFVESSYGIPLPWVVLPVVGTPSIFARHALGSAWSEGATPDFDQNLGLGVAFPLVRADLYIDPSEPDAPSISFGLSFPF